MHDHPELADIEAERLVLVENVDEGMAIRSSMAGTSSGCANARSIVSRVRNMRRLRSSTVRDICSAYDSSVASVNDL